MNKLKNVQPKSVKLVVWWLSGHARMNRKTPRSFAAAAAAKPISKNTNCVGSVTHAGLPTTYLFIECRVKHYFETVNKLVCLGGGCT